MDGIGNHQVKRNQPESEKKLAPFLHKWNLKNEKERRVGRRDLKVDGELLMRKGVRERGGQGRVYEIFSV
jgi:hypothetical protein